MAKPMTTKDKIREWISDNLRYMLLMIPVQMLPVPIPPARRMQRLSRQVSRKRQTIPVIQRIPIIRLSPLPRTMSRK